jgi:hypothetical protein
MQKFGLPAHRSLDGMKTSCAEEKMMTDDRTTVSDYLMLGTWEAITLLGQAGELCNADELSDMIAKAEAILISVVSELPRALADPAAPTTFDRSLRSPGDGAASQAPFERGSPSPNRRPAKSLRAR